MATASRIGVQDQDGSVRSIYVYSDGYPQGVGATLAAHYPTREAFEPVLALGDLSVLGPTVGGTEPHRPTGIREATQCIAYGRDRGQRTRPALRHENDGDFVLACDPVSYAYLLFSDGTWRVTEIGILDDEWHELEGRKLAA